MPPILGLEVGFDAPWWEVLEVLGWVVLGCSGGSMLGFILNGLLSLTHEGTLKHVMPIDIIECTRLVCAQGALHLGAFCRGGFWASQLATALFGGFGC